MTDRTLLRAARRYADLPMTGSPIAGSTPWESEPTPDKTRWTHSPYYEAVAALEELGALAKVPTTFDVEIWA